MVFHILVQVFFEWSAEAPGVLFGGLGAGGSRVRGGQVANLKRFFRMEQNQQILQRRCRQLRVRPPSHLRQGPDSTGPTGAHGTCAENRRRPPRAKNPRLDVFFCPMLAFPLCPKYSYTSCDQFCSNKCLNCLSDVRLPSFFGLFLGRSDPTSELFLKKTTPYGLSGQTALWKMILY